MRHSLFSLLFAVASLATGGCRRDVAGSCTSRSDCQAGFECVLELCRWPCLHDSECGTGEICVRGYCAAGDRRPQSGGDPPSSGDGGGTCPGGTDTITFDEVTTDTSDDLTCTLTHTTSGDNRLLLVALAHRGNNNIDQITYEDIDLTLLAEETEDPTIALYYLLNPETGSHDITVDFSGDTDVAIGAITLTGVNQVAWLDGPVGAAGGEGNTTLVTVTTFSENAWVLDAVATDNTYGSAASPQVERWERFEGEPHGFGSTMGPIAVPGSLSLEWTLDISEKWRTLAVPIRPACLP